jgi:hypothetical protein
VRILEAVAIKKGEQVWSHWFIDADRVVAFSNSWNANASPEECYVLIVLDSGQEFFLKEDMKTFQAKWIE